MAFGTDFTQQLCETNTLLSSCPGGKSLTSLVDFSLYGLNKAVRFPGYQVYYYNNHHSQNLMSARFTFLFMQYYHPFEAAEYRKVSRSLRAIGRDCIKKRIQMIESGERVPNDILTHILQLACKLYLCMIAVFILELGI